MSSPGGTVPTAVVTPMILPNIIKEPNEKRKGPDGSELSVVWRWNGNKWVMGATTTMNSVKHVEGLPSPPLRKLSDMDITKFTENDLNDDCGKASDGSPTDKDNKPEKNDLVNNQKETAVKQTIIYVSGQQNKVEQMNKVEQTIESVVNEICKTVTDITEVKVDAENDESVSSNMRSSDANKKKQPDKQKPKLTNRKRKITNVSKSSKKLKTTKSFLTKELKQLKMNHKLCTNTAQLKKPHRSKTLSTKKIVYCCPKRAQNATKVQEIVQSEKVSAKRYVPTKQQIMQNFLPEITTCAFCHLPANFLHGLGDLYGPYGPTFHDIMERRDDARERFYSALNINAFFPSKNNKNEICFDRDRNICYITSSGESSGSFVQTVSSTPTTQNTLESIEELMPRLRMMQTVDSILNEHGKKANSKRKKLQIPGFTGTIKFFESNSQNKDSNQNKLPTNLDTMVFMEPSLNLLPANESPPTKTNNNTSPRRKRGKKSELLDSTSVEVVHKFKTKLLWTHSVCAMWTPGVYLIQNQIFGIASAMRDAADIFCSFCHRGGATISCRNRKNVMHHYPCAIARGLELDEETLTAKFV
ncbi:uncharacterized protein LOC143460781 [Clavelina lepadiformis]|uniref:uncharacterized protein LOC143460781 n=1 Tax=Clavelina lepadiformis TaxID=159417 RepID=UPI0040416D9B